MGASMQLVAVDDVTAGTWDEVWQLTARFYASERGYVERSLKAHDRLALFRSGADATLVGVAAIQVEAMEFQGERIVVIFTSHAIVDERFRGHNLLQRAGMRSYLQACLRYPLHRKLWVFDTFSYRSYLLLPRNLHTFWPRRDRATPAWEAAFMEHFGRSHYGDAWNAGLVRRSPHKRLLAGTSPLDAQALRNPDIAFFARLNPGHAEGDMLLCLCPLTLANWWGIASRSIARMRRRRGAMRHSG
jgi:hypothetical protein